MYTNTELYKSTKKAIHLSNNNEYKCKRIQQSDTQYLKFKTAIIIYGLIERER